MRSAIIAALTLPVFIAAPADAQPAERPRVELMLGTAWWAVHDLWHPGPFTRLSTVEAGGTVWFRREGSWGWSLRYVWTLGVGAHRHGPHPDTGEYGAIRAFNGFTCTLRYRRPLGKRIGFEIGGGVTTGRFDNLVRTDLHAPWEYVHVEGGWDNLASGVLLGEAVLDIPLSRRFKGQDRARLLPVLPRRLGRIRAGARSCGARRRRLLRPFPQLPSFQRGGAALDSWCLVD